MKVLQVCSVAWELAMLRPLFLALFVSLLLSHNPALTPADFIKQLPKFSRPVNPSPLP